jgi:hypothetical protein
MWWTICGTSTSSMQYFQRCCHQGNASLRCNTHLDLFPGFPLIFNLELGPESEKWLFRTDIALF